MSDPTPLGATSSPSRGIVTPEGVVLEFETAGVASRGIAFLIDLALQLTVLLVVLIGLAITVGNASGGETLFVVVLLLVSFAVLFGYPAAMETFWNGRTLGHAALGLRVVTTDGAPTRFRHSAIRSIFRVVEGIVLFGAPAVIAMIFTPRDQRLGDLVAGTIVLRERSSSRLPIPVSFPPPPGWDAYVASLDVSAVTAEQYAIVRSFLLRVDELLPAARSQIAVRLANPLAVRMRHRPPPQVAPEIFLVCTAAAYQRRHASG